MAKANFPASPTNNQTVIIGGLTYVYNSSKGIWKDQISNIGSTSDNAPANPVDGQLWYNSLTGALFVYYDDGTSSQWVGVSGPAGTAGTDGDAGAAGAAGSTTTYANLAAFPSSGNTAGDQGYAVDTSILYVYYGSAWVPVGGGASVTTYANYAAFPSSGNDVGDMAFDIALKMGYIWDGTEWDKFSGKTPATLSSVTPTSYSGNTGQSITINGTGFVVGDVIDFVTADTSSVHRASSTSFTSTTQLVAVTPQAFTVANGPLTIRHTSGTVVVDLAAVVSTGASPVWTTAAGTLGSFNKDATLALTVVATDVDAGQTVTYAGISGDLPPGTSISSAGAITGAITTASVSSNTTYSKTVKASDPIGNFVNRIFDITILNQFSALYTFGSAVFNDGGIRGSVGPSQAQAIAALTITGYSAWKNDTSLFQVTNGIQRWTVPEDGTYRIQADGAANPSSQGGYGALIRGDFTLTNGTFLYMIVGQRPKSTLAAEHSGSGGSFVVKETGAASVVGDILVIAGAGGSGHVAGYANSISSANATANGNPGYGAGAGAAGTNGSGGANNPSGGGGGGGFLTDGGTSSTMVSTAKSWKNGGAGGVRDGTYEGGFGGGGQHGNTHGGGGGGYSGGGGGTPSPYVGGGAGSYNADVSSGNQVNTGGLTAQRQIGQITITKI